MAHLAVYKNDNPSTKKLIPYLLDVQSDLLVSLETRVVVPLYLYEKNGLKAISRLTPVIDFERKQYLVMTPQLAGVPAKLLKKAVFSLEAKRSEIINALDLLFTGF